LKALSLFIREESVMIVFFFHFQKTKNFLEKKFLSNSLQRSLFKGEMGERARSFSPLSMDKGGRAGGLFITWLGKTEYRINS